jgi:uncharacterized protein (DUF2267 family)
MTGPLGPDESPTLEAFVAQVQARGPLPSQSEADRVTRATVAALADAVSSTQAATLTTALPPELAGELTKKKGQANAFDAGAFLDRISGHVATVSHDELKAQVRAVLTTLAEWQPPGEFDDTLGQLPPGLADLFIANS